MGIWLSVIVACCHGLKIATNIRFKKRERYAEISITYHRIGLVVFQPALGWEMARRYRHCEESARAPRGFQLLEF